MNDKEYFQKYYQDHKEAYKERREKWCIKNPEKAKAINKRYKEKISKGKVVRVLGLRIKKPVLKPFNKRISPETLAKIKENTRINNKYIKFFTTVDNKDKYLVRRVMSEAGLIKK